jgi:hypothetical protein
MKSAGDGAAFAAVLMAWQHLGLKASVLLFWMPQLLQMAITVSPQQTRRVIS